MRKKSNCPECKEEVVVNIPPETSALGLMDICEHCDKEYWYDVEMEPVIVIYKPSGGGGPSSGDRRTVPADEVPDPLDLPAVAARQA